MEQSAHAALQRIPWDKGKLVGQKAPLKLKDIWAIRVRLQIGHRDRDLALFNLAIDSKSYASPHHCRGSVTPLRSCERADL